MLTFALLLSSVLGHLQSTIYKKFGDDWQGIGLSYLHQCSQSYRKHVLFTRAIASWLLVCGTKTFSHLMMIIFGQMDDIWTHFQAWLDMPPVAIRKFFLHASFSLTCFHCSALGNTTFHVSIFAVLFVNVALQYGCIRGVFQLTSAVGTLSCTFVITLRKFLSLLLSVLYFRNPFSLFHAIGAALVFGGAFVYIQPSSNEIKSTNTATDSEVSTDPSVKKTQ